MASHRVKLSSGEQTPEGRIVSALHYNGILDRLLKRDEYSGYPHNGGEHTLILHTSPEDTRAFFEAIEPLFSESGREGLTRLKEKAGLLAAA